jgi:hypothetical protein
MSRRLLASWQASRSTQLADDGQTDRFIADTERGGDSNTTGGRVDAYVQVLNVLSNYLDRKSRDGYRVLFNIHFDL